MTGDGVMLAGCVCFADTDACAERAEGHTHAALRAMPLRGEARRVLRSKSPNGACIALGVVTASESRAGAHSWEDPESRDVLIWSGALTNLAELHQHLERAQGAPIPAGCAPATLLMLSLRQFGLEAARHWRGVFSVAWWRAAEGRLTVWRDGLGQAPLFAAEIDGGLAFASELRALLQMGLTRSINPEALEVFLFNGHFVAPATPIERVSAIMPGERRSWESRGSDSFLFRPGGIPALSQNDAQDDAHDRVQRAFDAAIEATVAQDAAPAVPLSSGLDSCWLAARLAQRRGGDAVRTVSIAFAEKDYDESKVAEAVARRLGARHRSFMLTAQHVQQSLDGFIAALDYPSYDGLNAYFVAQFALECGADSLVSGLGGDELFGGYPETKWGAWLSAFHALAGAAPVHIRRAVAHWLSRDALAFGRTQQCVEPFWHETHRSRRARWLAAYQTVYCLTPHAARAALLNPGMRATGDSVYCGLPEAATARLLDHMNPDDMRAAMMLLGKMVYLSQRTVQDLRTVSAHAGLALRIPMLDDAFVETVERLPIALRASTRPERPFQWRMVRAAIGDGLLSPDKRSFAMPMERWLHQPGLRTVIKATLDDDRLANSIGLNADAVRSLCSRFHSGDKRVPWYSVWMIYVLMRWCALHGVTR